MADYISLVLALGIVVHRFFMPAHPPMPGGKAAPRDLSSPASQTYCYNIREKERRDGRGRSTEELIYCSQEGGVESCSELLGSFCSLLLFPLL